MDFRAARTAARFVRADEIRLSMGNDMSLPGFTAESSLYTTRAHYRTAGAPPRAEMAAGISPAGNAATVPGNPVTGDDHVVAHYGQGKQAEGALGALPRLNISGVYVTGASSGGYMATQLQVAYSSTFQGAGIFTAGPYSAAQAIWQRSRRSAARYRCQRPCPARRQTRLSSRRWG